jgi:hypothetical protein
VPREDRVDDAQELLTKAGAEAWREALRWTVFLLVVIPLLPVAAVAAILGSIWAVAKESFLAGSNVLSVWDDYEAPKR